MAQARTGNNLEDIYRASIPLGNTATCTHTSQVKNGAKNESFTTPLKQTQSRTILVTWLVHLLHREHPSLSLRSVDHLPGILLFVACPLLLALLAPPLLLAAHFCGRLGKVRLQQYAPTELSAVRVQ